MIKYLKIYFILLIVILGSVVFFMEQNKEEQLQKLSDHIIATFNLALSHEEESLLSFSLALSEDGALKEALFSDNESKGYQILNNTSKRFKKYTNLKQLRIQVITPDFYIFARSWDEGFEGMPIWWFRDDLAQLNQYSHPKSGVETGRLLTFKATSPIKRHNKLLGYIEVIELIDEFSIKLKRRGIELFALMDNKYLETSPLMNDFPLVHDYIIANQNFNTQLLKQIDVIDWNSLNEKKYFFMNGVLYLIEPMYNHTGDMIGKYLLVIPKNIVLYYRSHIEHFSLLTQFSNEDIYEVVESWKNTYNNFQNRHNKETTKILPQLYQDDRLKLEDKVRNIIKFSTQEELIHIIISHERNKQKVGVIK